MMRTRTYSVVEGALVNGSRREPGPGDVVVDEVAPHEPGDRLVPDPQNPRRAIPDPAEPARRAAKARLEAAIAAETRLLVLERLVVKGVEGAAEEVARIEAALVVAVSVEDKA